MTAATFKQARYYPWSLSLPKIILAVLFLSSASVWAGPTFDPVAATAGSDHELSTPIPKERRIYLFGPDRNKRMIFSSFDIKKVSDLWRTVILNSKSWGGFTVFRNNKGIDIPVAGLLQSNYPLEPGDVILISFPPRPADQNNVVQ